MKQRAHAWVALRALKMIDDWGRAPKLTELLSYYLSDVWDGTWLPDTRIVDMRYGHIFKMDSDPDFMFMYDGLSKEKRFIKSYSRLDSLLVGNRLCLEYVKGFEELKKASRSHPEGGHLPNRVIALSHMIGDMLKMGDFPLAAYTQKKKDQIELVGDASGLVSVRDLSSRRIRDLSSSANFSARQVALVFFLVSHYICDAHMPLHCDLRDLFATSRKTKGKKRRLPVALHPRIEELWDKNFPIKEDLILTDYTKETLDEILIDRLPEDSIIEIDKAGSNYQLSKRLQKRLKGDEWEEMVYVTRTSYTVARKWIPEGVDWVSLLPRHRSDFEEQISQGQGFGDGRFVEDFRHVTNCVFHDAVESIARIWYKAWRRFID